MFGTRLELVLKVPKRVHLVLKGFCVFSFIQLVQYSNMYDDLPRDGDCPRESECSGDGEYASDVGAC